MKIYQLRKNTTSDKKIQELWLNPEFYVYRYYNDER